MSRIKIAALLALVLGLVVAVAAFAGGFTVVTYDDTAAKITVKLPEEVSTPQFIFNGDFSKWTPEGTPAGWQLNIPPARPGWEVRAAKMDYAWPQYAEGGMNDAIGFFFRTGADGSQFAGMSQALPRDMKPGGYWVQVHVTAWEHKVESPYNAVAWYGFGHSHDPSSVKEWRELFPDEFPCANEAGRCNHLGRKELVTIPPNSVMHLWMGMKFPDYGAWTVFGVDDISITDLSDGIQVDITDFQDDGDIIWDPTAQR